MSALTGSEVQYEDRSISSLLSLFAVSKSQQKVELINHFQHRLASLSNDDLTAIVLDLTRHLIYSHLDCSTNVLTILSEILKQSPNHSKVLLHVLRPICQSFSNASLVNSLRSMMTCLHLIIILSASSFQSLLPPDVLVQCIGSCALGLSAQIELNHSSRAAKFLSFSRKLVSRSCPSFLPLLLDSAVSSLPSPTSLAFIGFISNSYQVLSLSEAQNDIITRVFLDHVLFSTKAPPKVVSLFEFIINSDLISEEWIKNHVIGSKFNKSSLKSPEVLGPVLTSFFKNLHFSLNDLAQVGSQFYQFGLDLILSDARNQSQSTPINQLVSVKYFSEFFVKISSLEVANSIVDHLFTQFYANNRTPFTRVITCHVVKTLMNLSSISAEDVSKLAIKILTYLFERLSRDVTTPVNQSDPLSRALLDCLVFTVSMPDWSDSQLSTLFQSFLTKFIKDVSVLGAILEGFVNIPSQIPINHDTFNQILSIYQSSKSRDLTLCIDCLMTMIYIHPEYSIILENIPEFQNLKNLSFLTDLVVDSVPKVAALTVDHLVRHVFTRCYQSVDYDENLLDLIKQNQSFLRSFSRLLTDTDFLIESCVLTTISTLVQLHPHLFDIFLSLFLDTVLDSQSIKMSSKSIRCRLFDLLSLSQSSFPSLETTVSLLTLMSSSLVDSKPASFVCEFFRRFSFIGSFIQFHSYPRVISSLLHQVIVGNSPNRIEGTRNLFRCAMFTSLLPQNHLADVISDCIVVDLSKITQSDVIILSHSSPSTLALNYPGISDLLAPPRKSRSADEDWALQERLRKDPLALLKPNERALYVEKLEEERVRRSEVEAMISRIVEQLGCIKEYCIGFKNQKSHEISPKFLSLFFKISESIFENIREISAEILELLANSASIPYSIVESSIRTCLITGSGSTTKYQSKSRSINHVESFPILAASALSLLSSDSITEDNVLVLNFALPLLNSLLLSSTNPSIKSLLSDALFTVQARSTVFKFSETIHRFLPRSDLALLIVNIYQTFKLPEASTHLSSLLSNADLTSVKVVAPFLMSKDDDVIKVVIDALAVVPESIYNYFSYNSQEEFLLNSPDSSSSLHFSLYLAAFVLQFHSNSSISCTASKVFSNLPWSSYLTRDDKKLTGIFANSLVDHHILNLACPLFIQKYAAFALGKLNYSSSHQVIDLLERLESEFVGLFDYAYPPLTDVELSLAGLDESSRRRLPKSTVNSDVTSSNRSTVLCALESIAPLVTPRLPSLLNFLLGFPLSDPVQAVVSQALNTGLIAVENLKDEDVDSVYNSLADKLNTLDTSRASDDKIRAGIVVWLGKLARKFSSEDFRVSLVVSHLLSVLLTPSEHVQKAVSQSISTITSLINDSQRPELIAQMIELLSHDVYAEQKAGAYGLAGLIKGFGLPSIAKYKLIDSISDLVSSENQYSREGALLAFAALSKMIGRLFEPYAIPFIPKLLSSLSDNVSEVRSAALSASESIMLNISPIGVKQLIPALSKALSATLWRTRVGAIELVKTFAKVAPHQISSSLPVLIPQLASLVVDPHTKVSSSAELCLRGISEIITAADLKPLSEDLIAAICDPASKTFTALSKIVSAKLSHPIDAPSLSLVVPLIQRGMTSRNFEEKQNAVKAFIDVSMLSSSSDLIGYIGSAINDIQRVVIDPIPAIRSVAATLCFTLTKKLGLASLSSLSSWTLEKLSSDPGSVVRNGCAQAYAALISAAGSKVMETNVREITSRLLDPSLPAVSRDGNIQLLQSIPTHYSTGKFMRFVSESIPVIFSSFHSDVEFVRTTSVSAIKSFIKHYIAPQSAFIPLFVKLISEALTHYSWRSRLCAVSVVFDFFLAAGNLKLKRESELQEVTLSYDEVALIQNSLGTDTYEALMSRLLFVKCDENAMVKQIALTVWKSLVRNTAKFIREIFPIFVQNILLALLGEQRGDTRVTLIAVINEICVKYHEELFKMGLDPLLDYLTASQSTVAERVGASTIIGAVFRHTTAPELVSALQEPSSKLVLSLLPNLTHENSEVRKATAQAVSVLITRTGEIATNLILFSLLNTIQSNSEQRDTAISALSEILTDNLQLLKTSIPVFLHSPSLDNLFALSALAAVAEDKFSPFIEETVSVLSYKLGIDPVGLSLADFNNAKQSKSEIFNAILSVFNNISPLIFASVVRFLYKELTSENQIRKVGALLISGGLVVPEFSEGSSKTVLINEILRGIFPCYASRYESIKNLAVESVTLVLKSEKELTGHVSVVVDNLLPLIETLVDSTGKVAIFDDSSVVKSFISVLSQGILSSSQDMKIKASNALSVVVRAVSPSSFKPFVISSAAPLVRSISENHNAEVYLSCLSCLTILFQTNSLSMKPFLSPIQTAIFKPLTLNVAKVRKSAIITLAEFVAFSLRIDPLITELCSRLGSSEYSTAVKGSLFRALSVVLIKVGSKVSPSVRSFLLHNILAESLLSEVNEIGLNAADAFSSYLVSSLEEEFHELLEERLLDRTFGTDLTENNIPEAVLLNQINVFITLIRKSTALSSEILNRISEILMARLNHYSDVIKEYIAKCFGSLICHVNITSSLHNMLMPQLAVLLTDPNPAVRNTALLSTYRIALYKKPIMEQHLPLFMPAFLAAIQVRNAELRKRAELALCLALGTDEGSHGLEKFSRNADKNIQESVAFYYEKVLSKISLDGVADVDSESESLYS
ncbi:hypothetical protein RCL1_002251 [Eukaryota sp. TZLM3-RCL]